MTNSFRKIDMKAETSLAEFMDRCFYSKLHDQNGNSIYFERKKDKDSQLEGVDVEIRVGEKRYLIDEKASLYYSNAMIPTFAFEIDSIQRGHDSPVKGWLVNDELNTEYYMLIWPNIKCERKEDSWIRKSLKGLKSTDFTIVEAMLIDKSELLLEINKRGYSTNRLIEYARLLRKETNCAKESVNRELDEDIKIMYSGKLAEQPVNAVVKKELIKKVAKAVYLISEDGYAIIKG